jgi:hypothetical protein
MHGLMESLKIANWFFLSSLLSALLSLKVLRTGYSGSDLNPSCLGGKDQEDHKRSNKKS